MPESTWEEALRGGDLAGALALAKERIRANPNDADLRLLLAHLNILAGDWQSAEKQLKVYGGFASSQEDKLLVMTIHSLIESEGQRLAVLAGEREPLIFGDPLPWAGDLIQMHRHLRAGEHEAAVLCREQVAEAAGPVAGNVGGKRFAWLGDTDWRFCSIFEAVIGGSYYWLPVQRVLHITLGEPKGLRDLVWQPVNFRFVNGGESPGFIPARYPGSEASDNPDIVLSRGTVWEETAPGIVIARGQRVLTDGDNDYSILDVRRIEFEPPEVEPAV
jgi:type VI secretion system protein ImpE